MSQLFKFLMYTHICLFNTSYTCGSQTIFSSIMSITNPLKCFVGLTIFHKILPDISTFRLNVGTTGGYYVEDCQSH